MSTEEMSKIERFSPLRQEREERGWTQSEVAERIGSTRGTISRWENGIKVPGPYYRQKLGELFGKSLRQLGFISESGQEHNKEVSFPQPIWNVPHRRNPFFTGREEVLAHLDIALKSSKAAALTQVQAISGLGGIGKTEIAAEYAYRYRDRYQAIFWIDASTHEALSNHFVSLATSLGLPEQHTLNQDIVVRQAVKRWLGTHANWLLIFDNVEDAKMITDYLPTDGIGNILFTTRLQALGAIAQSIEIKKMELDEGVMFLLHRTKVITPGVSLEQVMKEDWKQATEIVKALDGLPLALDQAGAYIEETRCGLSEYLSLFEIHRKDLLLQRGNFPVGHPASVAATWSLSFQQVKQENIAATDLLYLLAFLDSEAIPKELITLNASELGPTLEKVASDPLQLNRTIEVLLRYSLIQRAPKTSSLSIHRLVQAVLKDGMEKEEQRTWVKRAIRALNNIFPDIELQTWERYKEICQHYLPHIQACAKYSEEYMSAFSEAARLFNAAAFYLLMYARYQQAELLLLKALTIRLEISETNHLDMARILNDLGEVYRSQGKYQEAETQLSKALEIRQEMLGEEHPDVAQTVLHYADLYRVQGNYKEAEIFYLRATHIRKTALGIDSPLVAECYYGLAKLYYSREKYQEAEKYCKEALRIQEQHLGGDNHPMIALILSMLAKIYQRQNNLDLAEETNKRALGIQKNTSGANHPNIATILNNLVEIYHIEGRLSEAESLIDEAFKIHEQVFGLDHPSIAYSFSNRAEHFFLQEDYAQAEVYYKKAQSIRKRHLISTHPRIASTYYDLAKLYTALGRFEEAESFSSKALFIREHAFGHNDPALASTLEQRATLLRKLKRESEVHEIEARIQVMRATPTAFESP